LLCFMTVCMYRDIHTLQPYIIDFTQRGCHTLRLIYRFSRFQEQYLIYWHRNNRLCSSAKI